MQATNLEDVDFPDFVVLDKDRQVILIAEVQGFPFDFKTKRAKENAILQLSDYLQAAKTLIPFAMLVDVKTIMIFQWDGKHLSEPILCLNTPDVLSLYETEFSNKKIYNLYLITLTEAWLRDLAYHWKSQIPPFRKQIADIGLLQLLEDGTTQAY